MGYFGGARIAMSEPVYPDTFEILTRQDGSKAIVCKGCGRASFNPNDVELHYCGFCHVFHDDIWPPSRQWWIDQRHNEARNH